MTRRQITEERSILEVCGGKTHQITDLGVSRMRPTIDLLNANRVRASSTEKPAANKVMGEFSKYAVKCHGLKSCTSDRGPTIEFSAQQNPRLLAGSLFVNSG